MISSRFRSATLIILLLTTSAAFSPGVPFPRKAAGAVSRCGFWVRVGSIYACVFEGPRLWPSPGGGRLVGVVYVLPYAKLNDERERMILREHRSDKLTLAAKDLAPSRSPTPASSPTFSND